ncbi:MAG TPA: hypothetical protein VGH28_07270 [Polyangiaceae bacterium]|jgi:hypothetical protein
MQYAPSPYNPYVVPAMPLTAASIDPTGHRPQVRIFLLISAVASALLYVGGIAGVVAAIVVDPSHPEPVFILAGYATMLFGALLLYVKLGLALYWLHGAWKWLPMDQRVGRDGKRRTPGDVFMLLIPYFHWYWQFPINLGLCDAMERLRQVTYGTQTPKRDVAMWAAICEIIPFANFFVAPFLWASYMKSIDLMHDEIATALARQP